MELYQIRRFIFLKTILLMNSCFKFPIDLICTFIALVENPSVVVFYSIGEKRRNLSNNLIQGRSVRTVS